MKITIFLIILSIILISGAGCQIDNNQSKERDPFECPEGIIPDRFDLQNTIDNRYAIDFVFSTSVPPYFRAYRPKWLDGTPVQEAGGYPIPCYGGSKPGENINHISCTIVYKKTPPPIEGIIQSPIIYTIGLVLDAQDHTEEGYKIISKTCSK